MSRRQRRERRTRRRRHAEPRGLRTRQSLITGATITAGALAGFTSTAAAADFQVTNTNDSTVGDANCLAGNCTLRQAVTAANNGGDAIDNITFQSGLSGQIDLIHGQISVTGGTYFLGPGASTLRISGNSSSRIFNIDPTVSGRPVGIYDLSLMYGHPASNGNGGAISNSDALLKIALDSEQEHLGRLWGRADRLRQPQQRLWDLHRRLDDHRQHRGSQWRRSLREREPGHDRELDDLRQPLDRRQRRRHRQLHRHDHLRLDDREQHGPARRRRLRLHEWQIRRLREQPCCRQHRDRFRA